MNTPVYKRNSWHYRFAKRHDSDIRYYDEYDICSYVRAVINGLGTFCVWTVIAGLIALSIIGAIVYIAASTIYGVAEMPLGIIPGVAVGIVVVLAIAVAILERVWDNLTTVLNKWIGGIMSRRPRRAPKRSFIKDAWYSFKNKVCFKVKFVN